jgi:hypothetical protein
MLILVLSRLNVTTLVINALRTLPEVDFVEKDQLVRTMDIQKGAPWVRVLHH